MIRINLVGARATKAASSAGKVNDMSVSSGSDELIFEDDNPKKEALTSLALIALPLLALMVYQYQNIPSLRSQLNTLSQELATLQEENSRTQNIVDEIKRFHAEKERLEAQIAAIQKLSDGRMVPVQAIENLQEALPEKVWLDSLVLRDGVIEIKGQALTDLDITAFMERLGNSIYISNVQLMEAGQNTEEVGSTKTFSVSASLEGS